MIEGEQRVYSHLDCGGVEIFLSMHENYYDLCVHDTKSNETDWVPVSEEFAQAWIKEFNNS